MMKNKLVFPELGRSPTVSVVITAYGRPDGLSQTIESISKQTLLPDEVFVYDDASPVDPTKLVMQWDSCFDSFSYIRQPKNLGMPGNLNEAISQATGDIVVNLHDGDVYKPELLIEIVDAFERHQTAGLAFWDATKSYLVDRDIDAFTSGLDFFEKHYLYQTSSKIWGTVAVRREVYDCLLPFDSRFGAWSDVDMWMQVCGLSDIAFIHKPLEIRDQTGEFRPFTWSKALRFHWMLAVNTKRLYEDKPMLLETAFLRQSWIMKKRWIRFMLGRIRHGEFCLLWQGICHWKQYFSSVKQFVTIPSNREGGKQGHD